MSQGPGGRRKPTREGKGAPGGKGGQFKEKPQNEVDLEQIIGFVSDVVNTTLAQNAALGTEIKRQGAAVIKLADKLVGSDQAIKDTSTALTNVLNSPAYVKTLKKGTEDQTRQLRGLNIKFNLMSTFLSGIISGFEPIFDVVEEVGEMIGNSLRPLLSTIAEGLIPFLPLIQVALDGVTGVLSPLAGALKEILDFLNPATGLDRSEAFGIVDEKFLSNPPETEAEFFDFLRDWIDAILGNTEELEKRREEEGFPGLVEDPFQ